MQIETYEEYAQRLVPFDKIKRKDKTNYTYIISNKIHLTIIIHI